jgi:DNA-binding GntR family transcriptional regulator
VVNLYLMVTKISLKQKAYDHIKSKIVNCDYPPNSFLNEKLLMEEIQVSRTPIREALSKLEQENLVTILPKRGVSIRGVSAGEITMIYQTRELIESFIIRKDGHGIDRDRLLEMRTRLSASADQLSLADIFKQDDDFHKLITSGSKNMYLLQVLDHMYLQVLRLRTLTGKRDISRFDQSQAEHQHIVDFLLEGDYDRAADAVQQHLANAREFTLGFILDL